MALRERKSQKEEENEVPPVAPKPTVSARQEKLIRERDGMVQVRRYLLLALGATCFLWVCLKAMPWLQGQTGTQQDTHGSQTYLPGMRFGMLSPLDTPKTSPVDLHLKADVPKRDAVREAFKWSWDSYEKCAMGADELHPISCKGSNLTSAGGIGYTVVDSLDSLLIMDFKEEYHRAAQWCKDNLNFDRDATFNTFETTIRVLGGLLSAHYLTSVSDDASIRADAPFYLDAATDLGDRLLGAFDTPSGLPYSGINLKTRQGIPDRDNQGLVSLAEAASLQLELKYLSHLTGDQIYWRKAEGVTRVIRNQVAHDGIAPIFLSPETGSFVASEIRLGSRGDSYYEYLLKQYLQTDRQEPVYRDMYDDAMSGIKKHLIARTKRKGLIFTKELAPARHPESGGQTWQVVPKQDHLVCFFGGSFILGVTEGNRRDLDWANLDERDQEDFLIGRGIVETCVDTYDTATGLGPEIAMFYLPEQEEVDEADWYIKPGDNLIDARNILRPETVESLMLAYRSTGDERYREWGWKIFQAFQKHCRVATGGYAIIKDVRVLPAEQEDRMETFWLSETLKYLYLLFDDSDHIPLNEHVFNTEAHILPIFKPAMLTSFATS